MVEYVGFDVSKEETSFCVMDKIGKIIARGKTITDPAALFEALKEHCLYPERTVMETGTLSHWLVRELRELGMPVELIDARQAHPNRFRIRHRRQRTTGTGLHAGQIVTNHACR